MSKENGALFLIIVRYSTDIPISDKQEFSTTEDVLLVNSNFHKDRHESYKQQPPKVKSNKGRKPKKKPPKTAKKNSGTGDCFPQSIQFDIMIEGEAYCVKLFGNNSCNISSIKKPDKELVKRVVDKLFAFIEHHQPGSNIRVESINISLGNLNTNCGLKDSDPNEAGDEVINMYKLRNYYKQNNVFTINDNEYKVITSMFESAGLLVMIEKINGCLYQAKLTPRGKIHIFGGKDVSINEAIAEILIRDSLKFKQIGFAAVNKKDSKLPKYMIPLSPPVQSV